MDYSDYHWHERNGPAPRAVPVVAAMQVRMGEQRGVELHLAEDPEHTVARVWTDGRITLGPNRGVLNHDGSGAEIALEPAELRAVVRVGKEWSVHRRRWAAFTAGWFGKFSRFPRDYLPGRWAPDWPRRLDEVREGALSCERVDPRRGETFASFPVVHAVINACRERTGIVVRGPNNLCISLVRGSFAVSRRWPQPVSNVRNVALLLIRNITNGWIMGESGPLEQFNADAAEVDALGLHVLAAVAAELRRTTRRTRRR